VCYVNGPVIEDTAWCGIGTIDVCRLLFGLLMPVGLCGAMLCWWRFRLM